MDMSAREKIFFQHPMNQKMLEGTNLSQYDPQELAAKYIGIAKAGVLPTDDQVEQVRTGVIDYCKKVHGTDAAALQEDVDGINATWPEMRERFAKSPGLTQLMLDYGCNSRYFYQYLWLAGQKLYAAALEAKDGRAMPVSGKPVFENIPDDDWMMVVCVEEPSHAARRSTDGACQNLLRGAKAIFEAGAGLLPAYRNYGYPLGQLNQRIVACDSDPRMPGYLKLLLDRPPEEYGIEYIVGDLMDVMDDPKYFGQFDVVRMTGLLSYFPVPADKLKIMQKAKRLLRAGGIIMTDEWVMGVSLMRSALINLWPIDPSDPHRLSPAADVPTAIRGMNDICKEIGMPYVCLNDLCNGNQKCWTQVKATPKCVMFAVGEAASQETFTLIKGATLPGVVW